MTFLFKRSTVEEVLQIRIFLDYFNTIVDRNILSARLPGAAGPINCLAFTDGKFLASGGKCRHIMI
jgi:hypothetical protein